MPRLHCWHRHDAATICTTYFCRIVVAAVADLMDDCNMYLYCCAKSYNKIMRSKWSNDRLSASRRARARTRLNRSTEPLAADNVHTCPMRSKRSVDCFETEWRRRNWNIYSLKECGIYLWRDITRNWWFYPLLAIQFNIEKCVWYLKQKKRCSTENGTAFYFIQESLSRRT